jgi:hypothetical protein
MYKFILIIPINTNKCFIQSSDSEIFSFNFLKVCLLEKLGTLNQARSVLKKSNVEQH